MDNASARQRLQTWLSVIGILCGWGRPGSRHDSNRTIRISYGRRKIGHSMSGGLVSGDGGMCVSLFIRLRVTRDVIGRGK